MDELIIQILSIPITRALVRVKANRVTLAADLANVHAGAWAEVTVKLDAPEPDLDRQVRAQKKVTDDLLRRIADRADRTRRSQGRQRSAPAFARSAASSSASSSWLVRLGAGRGAGGVAAAVPPAGGVAVGEPPGARLNIEIERSTGIRVGVVAEQPLLDQLERSSFDGLRRFGCWVRFAARVEQLNKQFGSLILPTVVPAVVAPAALGACSVPSGVTEVLGATSALASAEKKPRSAGWMPLVMEAPRNFDC